MITINDIKYYTTIEVSKLLGVQPQTIKRWRDNGKLQFNKLGAKKFLYTEQQIELFLKGGNNGN